MISVAVVDVERTRFTRSESSVSARIPENRTVMLSAMSTFKAQGTPTHAAVATLAMSATSFGVIEAARE